MKKRLAFVAVLSLAGSAALAGCGANDGGGAAGSAEPAGGEETYVTVNGCEPENPLLPGLTNETCGGNMSGMLYGRLVAYDETGKPQNELAESITTDDSQTYTIKLKAGAKFTDGTEIKAANFVNAWNAVVKEKQRQSFFFEDIEGYEEGKEMSGLQVVDDHTFTVKLSQPESDWPLRLGYLAYAPLPDKAMGDGAKDFGENPDSSGPYKLASWNHKQDATFVPNPDYDGPRKAQNNGVKFKFYATPDPAYNDLLSGNLDVLDNIPDTAFSTFEKELGDRAVNKPSAVFQSLAINMDDPHFGGEEGKLRRQALSMAINRDEVTQAIFKGTRTPAKDFTSPVIAGWSDKVPGNEVLNFDPAKAKELWAKADAMSKYDETFKVAYNSDGGHQAWVEALCNQIKNNLGIAAEGDPYPDFKSLRTKVSKHEIKTAYRTGWMADYPSIYNFLGPLYATGAPSNDVQYSNPEVDKLLKEGLSAKTTEEGIALFTKAQTQLLSDLPVLPLWYSNMTGGSSDKVQNVKFGWDGGPLLYQVTKK
ncbi:ABC transporter substrate-binding protein [Boudabousia tangfeifanii]|uniref:ABC transporter substrate-binding protein n=1 Tax=Boudabousia tangfeifanii TaxID=1912795 RepID=A0A1D9MM80_9ACTO|nr:ABC transporter substrate-binding protein [Boudabousia tangfeifanii]AOZ73273.1 ABC transporter substrate-binding protein [Boudabousia tangfeifanii]